MTEQNFGAFDTWFENPTFLKIGELDLIITKCIPLVNNYIQDISVV